MKKLLLTLLSLMVFSAVVFAQSESGTISGRVTDPSGAVIIGATCTVTNIDTNVSGTTKTNEAGLYVFTSLKPGNYRLTVENPGFHQLVKTGIVLHTQDSLSENFNLQVGSVTESVTVTASPLNVETTSPAVATTITADFVSRLPLNGRTIQNLFALVPGALPITSGVNAVNEGQMSVNGLQTTMNYLTIDGVSANLYVGTTGLSSGAGNGTIPGWGVLGLSSNLVSTDALQEFKVQTATYSAEFGRTPGAQIQLTTKSGTNSWHGNAYEYFRNDKLNATDWFVNSKGLKKPPMRDNQFGGTLGGPIWKDHTFFFFSYEGIRLRLPQVYNGSVTSQYLRNTASPSLKPFLSQIPAPTGPDATNLLSAPFTVSYSNPQTQDSYGIRVDHSLSSKIKVFGRYSYAMGTLMSISPASSQAYQYKGPTITLTGGTNIVFAPSLANDFRFNWSRNKYGLATIFYSINGTTAPPDSALFPSPLTAHSASFWSFPSVSIGQRPSPYYGQRTQVNITDSFSWLRGRHIFKFGFDYRSSPVHTEYSDLQMNVSFSTVASVQNGVASSLTLGKYSPAYVDYDWKSVSAFAQDTWRLTPRLTFDLGLRWDLNPPPSITPPTPFVVADGVTPVHFAPANAPLFATIYRNFAPRLGAAYSISNKAGHELVVRGGYGLFYNVGSNTFGNVASVYYPHYASWSLSNVAYPFSQSVLVPPTMPTLGVLPLPSSSSFVAVFDKDFVMPRVHEWSLAVEKGFGTAQKLTVSYVGNAGRRLTRVSSLFYVQNLYPVPSPDFVNQLVNLNTNRAGNCDSSDYEALQIQFMRRTKHLNWIFNYTWSHAIDTGSYGGNINGESVFTYNFNQDRGNSAFDRRHRVSSAVTWDLPSVAANGGVSNVLNAVTREWSFDAIFQAEDGAPFDANILYPFNSLYTQQSPLALRADLVKGVPLYIYGSQYPGGRTPNPNAFAFPALLGKQGNAGRNVLRGLGFWQPDIALGRKFSLTERVGLLFKAELFNAFNHPNFAPWNPNWGQVLANGTKVSPISNWGVTTMLNNTFSAANNGVSSNFQVGGPRSIQFSLKLSF